MTIAVVSLTNGGTAGSSTKIDTWNADLPLTHAGVLEMRERAIEAILQHPDNQAREYRRAGVQVFAFLILVADRNGEIKEIRAGDML
jgi:hypothetical protein